MTYVRKVYLDVSKCNRAKGYGRSVLESKNWRKSAQPSEESSQKYPNTHEAEMLQQPITLLYCVTYKSGMPCNKHMSCDAPH